jgi:hypothetical protein
LHDDDGMVNVDVWWSNVMQCLVCLQQSFDVCVQVGRQNCYKCWNPWIHFQCEMSVWFQKLMKYQWWIYKIYKITSNNISAWKITLIK